MCVQVYRVRVHNCSSYVKCFDCLNARDPYCGWCDTQRRCTLLIYVLYDFNILPIVFLAQTVSTRRHGYVSIVFFSKNSFIPRCLFHFFVIVNLTVWFVFFNIFGIFSVFFFFQHLRLSFVIFLLITRYHQVTKRLLFYLLGRVVMELIWLHVNDVVLVNFSR